MCKVLVQPSSSGSLLSRLLLEVLRYDLTHNLSSYPIPAFRYQFFVVCSVSSAADVVKGMI